MVHHYQGCTVCNHCRSGWSQLCQEVPIAVYGNNAHGGHAHYLKVPANTLLPLADELSFAAGAAISCGTGTAYGALRRMNLSGNDVIAIFGQGPVGLSATQLAVAMGARVIALDVSEERLERAKEFGAWAVVNPRSNDPVGAIKDLTHGRGADCTLDTSSSPEARIAAIRSSKVWGTMCFVGEGGDVRIDVSPDVLAQATHDDRRPGPSRPSGRRNAPASSSSARSTWTRCSPTGGRSTRRRRRTSCSTPRRPARVSSLCEQTASPSGEFASP